MDTNTEKSSLRKVLLERRDSTSYDFIKLASQKIHGRLKQIEVFRNAKKIACYYPIGSEVKTQDIMQELLGDGKEVCLPKVVDDNLVFRKIGGLNDLEKGSFGILEPKDNCSIVEDIDVVLVPTVAITKSGIRLGYGYGFYDRFLASTNAKTIALTYSKQIVKAIPTTKNDIKIDWVVTEEEYFDTSKIG
ncbi:MAG TPA: 5-formyltetrahydrofolate cyclo-ligase [Nitrosopumilaceae archaeon]